jgi:hypothetical protein
MILGLARLVAVTPPSKRIEITPTGTYGAPESLAGPERADAWDRVIKVSPGFASDEQEPIA